MYISNQCSHLTYIHKVVSINEEFVNSRIKELKPDWTSHGAKKVDIRPDKDMEVKINGEDVVKILAQYGLTIEYEDIDIESIESLTDNVSVYAVIGY